MVESNPPAGGVGDDPRSPEETFALLGNDTRVGILQALWDVFESGTGDNAVPYSDLFDRVDIDDSGNFSYHLEKLTGPFVRKTEDGYELKQTGINVVRAIVAGTVTEDPSFGPTGVDVDCPLCGAAVEITYGDEVVDVSCRSCPGRRTWRGEPGHLFGALVPPVGIEERAPEAAFRAAVGYTLHQLASFNDGVCPDCAGSAETTLDVCPDHDPGDGLCPACGRRNLADVRFACTTCKRSAPPPVSLVVLDDPDVTAFYHEHGLAHRFASWDAVARSYRIETAIHATDPPAVVVTIPAGNDELRLVVDDDTNVARA